MGSVLDPALTILAAALSRGERLGQRRSAMPDYRLPTRDLAAQSPIQHGHRFALVPFNRSPCLSGFRLCGARILGHRENGRNDLFVVRGLV
jgi:hypothetical protein